MGMLIRPGASVLLGAGAVLIGYLTLSPAVWSRETLDVFLLGAAFAAGGNLAHEISAARSKAVPGTGWSEWLRVQIAEALAYPAALVLVSVLLGGAGPSDNLSAVDQRVVLALACLVLLAIGCWFHTFMRRARRVQDVERQARLEQVRVEARRDVAQFIEQLDGPAADRTARE